MDWGTRRLNRFLLNCYKVRVEELNSLFGTHGVGDLRQLIFERYGEGAKKAIPDAPFVPPSTFPQEKSEVPPAGKSGAQETGLSTGGGEGGGGFGDGRPGSSGDGTHTRAVKELRPCESMAPETCRASEVEIGQNGVVPKKMRHT